MAQGPRHGAVTSWRAWPEPPDYEISSVWLAEAKSGNPTCVPTHTWAASQGPRAVTAGKAAARSAPGGARLLGLEELSLPRQLEGRRSPGASGRALAASGSF